MQRYCRCEEMDQRYCRCREMDQRYYRWGGGGGKIKEKEVGNCKR